MARILRPKVRRLARKLSGRGGRGWRGVIFSGRGRGGGNCGGGRGKKNAATRAADKAADKAALAAFLLKKYGPGGCKLVAAEAATSTDEEVVCEGEKTHEERDAELRGEAVPVDE